MQKGWNFDQSRSIRWLSLLSIFFGQFFNTYILRQNFYFIKVDLLMWNLNYYFLICGCHWSKFWHKPRIWRQNFDQNPLLFFSRAIQLMSKVINFASKLQPKLLTFLHQCHTIDVKVKTFASKLRPRYVEILTNCPNYCKSFSLIGSF